MKSILLLLIAFSAFGAAAQSTGWKVVHNGNLLLKSSTENEAYNIVTIHKKELNKSGGIEASYVDNAQPTDWQRTVAIFNEVDDELMAAQGNTLFIKNEQLKTLAANNKKLNIFTWALPTDPELAARIRIKRIHVATITVK